MNLLKAYFEREKKQKGVAVPFGIFVDSLIIVVFAVIYIGIFINSLMLCFCGGRPCAALMDKGLWTKGGMNPFVKSPQ